MYNRVIRSCDGLVNLAVFIREKLPLAINLFRTMEFKTSATFITDYQTKSWSFTHKKCVQCVQGMANIREIPKKILMHVCLLIVLCKSNV